MITTIISILLIIATIAKFFIDSLNKSIIKDNEQITQYNEAQEKERHHKQLKSLINFGLPKKRILLTGAVVTFLLGGLFFWNEAGTATSVQYPWGGDKMVKTQGLKLKFWGRLIPIKYEMSIKDVITKDGELSGNNPGIYNRRANLWEFQDAIKAEIAVSIIASISMGDEEKFLDMADRNGSEYKLVVGRILPNVDAALKNTCKLMDAQAYISGKASDFDRYFKDQLQNGMYLVEEYNEQDNYSETIGDTTTVRKFQILDKNKQSKFRIKCDEQGNIMRATDLLGENSNTLGQYGISIQQAIVTGIDWEQSFDQRLQLQKEQVAQTQLEKQEAEKEFYRAKKEIAKGESEKAKERARLEKIQIQQTIEAETEAKVAEFNLIKEKKQYEVEVFKSKSKKVAADATYYENSKRNAAGITPQEKLAGDIQMNNDKWTSISKMRFDGVYMNGQSKGGQDGLLSSLLGAEVAKGLNKKK